MVNAAQWQLLVNEINTNKVSFADALSKGKIQRKCQNLGDIIHWRPTLQIMGDVSPRPSKVYASGGKVLLRCVCSAAREALGRPRGGEGRGHIVSPRAQFVTIIITRIHTHIQTHCSIGTHVLINNN